jgi:hypothetical protein
MPIQASDERRQPGCKIESMSDPARANRFRPVTVSHRKPVASKPDASELAPNNAITINLITSSGIPHIGIPDND